MEKTKKAALVLLASLLCLNAFAQTLPDFGGGCTNCPPITNYFISQPYVPGLKLAIQHLSGTNLPINLREADPAGKYDIYYASNLTSSTWSDVLGGTNGQTNFTLTMSQPTMGFFRAARSDTPVADAAGMTFSFPSQFATTNWVTASVAGGGPDASMAILVNNTDVSSAQWIPYSAVPLVNLGTNDGTYEIVFGFKGSNGIPYWATTLITLDTTPPLLTITNPTASVLSEPFIQLQGFANEKLSSVTYSISNATGFQTNLTGLFTGCSQSTNENSLITNYFQCFDVGLTNGLNLVTLKATDLAGNQTTTNLTFTLDYSSDTNPPVVQITWPQNGTQVSGANFTLDGQLDDATETVSASITDTNGDTNVVSGLVERNGKFWVQNLPLNSGTNNLTLTVADAAGNITVTNISVVQSTFVLTMNPVSPDSDLWKSKVNLSGTISDATYAVWANGVKGTNNGDGTWSANNVPTTPGGTASFTIIGYSPDETQPDGSHGN